jgi:hypothetical protein
MCEIQRYMAETKLVAAAIRVNRSKALESVALGERVIGFIVEGISIS